MAVVTRGYEAVDSVFAAAGFVPGRLSLRGALDFISPLRLARVLNRMEAPVVIHVHNFKDAFTAVRARSLMAHPENARVVVTRHLVKPASTRAAERDVYRRADAIVFVSQTAYDAFMTTKPDCDPSRLSVIYNAVNVPADIAPEAVPQGEVRLVFMGRLVPEKGVETLLDAIALLRDIPGVKLHIAGSGAPSYFQSLRNRATTLGVADCVEWRGHMAGVWPLAASACVGVVPSVATEAFGLTAAEFMGCGVPVVASDRGGLAEVVTDGVDSLLVPAEQPAAFADAIRRLVTDRALRDRLGRAAAATVASRFNYSTFYNEIMAIYEGNDHTHTS